MIIQNNITNSYQIKRNSISNFTQAKNIATMFSTHSKNILLNQMEKHIHTKNYFSLCGNKKYKNINLYSNNIFRTKTKT